MGAVVQLKRKINDSFNDLRSSVDQKISLVEDKIKSRLESDVNLIHKMVVHHLSSGGKRIRALLTLGCSKLCGYSKGLRDVNLAACVELIHSATLLHDDVIDKSVVRRGKKTANKIWGNQSSILVGDYLLSRCFEIMVEDNDHEVLKLLSSTSSKIAQGEVLQLQHKGEIDMLEEIYLKIISSKTASLFAAATKVGGIITNKSNKEKDALQFYGKNLGLIFQIADDTLDYNSNLNLFGKKTGKDFFEGKVTSPTILVYQRAIINEKEFLIKIFKQNERSKEDYKIMLKLISKYNIIYQCYKKAEYFVNLASNSLSLFKPSKEKSILENLISFSLERSF